MAIKHLLLLSGAIGSGKTSVAAILTSQNRFSQISSSAYLRRCATSAGLSIDRSTLQGLGDDLDEKSDFGWILSAVAVPAIDGHESVENWLFDAVRKPRQVQHFRARYDSFVRHVHLWAPEAIIEARYETKKTLADPSYRQVIQHPNEIAARSLGSMADAVYDTSCLSSLEIVARIVKLWQE